MIRLTATFRCGLRALAALAFLLPMLALAQAPKQEAVALLRDDPAPPSSPLAGALASSRALLLDLPAARAALAAAPAEGQPGTSPLVVAIPLPTGGSARFAIRQTAVMAPELAAKYPDIRTYAGAGLDDPTATIRLDLTSAGFHAQILSAKAGTVFIDPAIRGDAAHYLVFFKRDMKAVANPPSCAFKPVQKKESVKETQDESAAERPGPPSPPPAVPQMSSGGALRTYRLALAATAEYTRFHGGTVAAGLAAMVTTVNRVVGVYEKELAVRMVLVANTDQLIYTNAATDGYTNNDGGTMLDENQLHCDSLIGTAHYDIGHVVSTNGGGIAGYAVVCDPGRKGNGVTGTNSPVGDAFDIDYVAHEMGHQFSGSHPFNSVSGSCDGNREPGAAWEAGSGSTIMGYAGICSPDDLQAHSDAYFGVGNYEEMRPFIESNACATLSITGNNPPVVTVPASDKTIPKSTPFKLTANASDADGDVLTYSWEEQDLGPAGGPSATQVTGATPPIFRPWVPDTMPTRYFPRLVDLVRNRPHFGEKLPTVARDLTFKCAVRDLHAGPVGVIGGVTSSDEVVISVTAAAGPFAVTAPNTAFTATGDSALAVTWNVAGTDANSVNCGSVNIRLSTDGGMTYPTFLAQGLPNNGTATVTLPAVATTTARIMVEAADNFFFDISNADFTIRNASPCAPPAIVSVDSITTASALLPFTPNPRAVSYQVTTTPATTAQTVTTSPIHLAGLQPGVFYTVNITSTCDTGTSVTANARFTTKALPVCSVPSELSAQRTTPTSATIQFVGATSAVTYTATTLPATTTQVVTSSPVTLPGLAPNTAYAVLITSNCANGDTSDAAQFVVRSRRTPPPNDLCVNALPLTLGTPVTGTTLGVTDTSDPADNCVTTIDGGGVFYTLTTAGGDVIVTTCQSATRFDTKLFVFTGPCGGPYACISGNDDAACTTRNRSTVQFNSVAGTPYWVFVSGSGTVSGIFGLLATYGPVAVAPSLGNVPAFEVAPNPTSAGAGFHITLAQAASSASLTLTNILGQPLARQAVTCTTADMSTAHLPAGTYLLTLQADGMAPVTRRVVVE